MKEIKFYSPLTVKVLNLKNEYLNSQRQQFLEEVYKPINYFSDIKNALETFNKSSKLNKFYNNEGLLFYITKSTSKECENLVEKILNVKIDITILKCNNNRQLASVCTIYIREDLTEKEVDVFKKYLESQYSDGYGAILEKEKIRVNYYEDINEIQVLLWLDDYKYFIKTKEELELEGLSDVLVIKEKNDAENDFLITM